MLHTSRLEPQMLPKALAPAHLKGAYGKRDTLDATPYVLDAIATLGLDAIVALGGDGTLALRGPARAGRRAGDLDSQDDGQRRLRHRLRHRLFDRHHALGRCDFGLAHDGGEP